MGSGIGKNPVFSVKNQKNHNMLGVGRFIRESHFLQSIFIKIDLNLSGRHKILSLGFMEAIWIYSWIVHLFLFKNPKDSYYVILPFMLDII